MNHRYLLPAALILAACTAEPLSAAPQPKLHMPLTYGTWEVKHAQDGKSCVATSGYRGVSVEKTATGARVSSNETLEPGENLTLTIGDHRYETGETNFSDADSAAIVEDFSQGKEAFLRVKSRRGNGHADHIVKLDKFADAYKQCGGEKKTAKAKKAKKVVYKAKPAASHVDMRKMADKKKN